METAGLRCAPEMWPMAKAMVRTVRPKANATPRKPMPSWGKPAASTADPQPPKTSQKVPKNSAKARVERDIEGARFLRKDGETIVAQNSFERKGICITALKIYELAVRGAGGAGSEWRLAMRGALRVMDLLAQSAG